jgi:hypothetical protein
MRPRLVYMTASAMHMPPMMRLDAMVALRFDGRRHAQRHQTTSHEKNQQPPESQRGHDAMFWPPVAKSVFMNIAIEQNSNTLPYIRSFYTVPKTLYVPSILVWSNYQDDSNYSLLRRDACF